MRRKSKHARSRSRARSTSGCPDAQSLPPLPAQGPFQSGTLNPPPTNHAMWNGFPDIVHLPISCGTRQCSRRDAERYRRAVAALSPRCKSAVTPLRTAGNDERRTTRSQSGLTTWTRDPVSGASRARRHPIVRNGAHLGARLASTSGRYSPQYTRSSSARHLSSASHHVTPGALRAASSWCTFGGS
jgi:hypothetical protein